jgi:hypothetical protein
MDEHVVPALKKAKHNHEMWRASNNMSSCPKLFIGVNNAKPLCFCFGCKKVARYLPPGHLYTCKEAQKHIDTLKAMLDSEEVTIEKVVEVSDGADITAMKKKMADMQKENDALGEMVDEHENKNEQMVDLVKEILGSLTEGERDMWMDRLNSIKYG